MHRPVDKTVCSMNVRCEVLANVKQQKAVNVRCESTCPTTAKNSCWYELCEVETRDQGWSCKALFLIDTDALKRAQAAHRHVSHVISEALTVSRRYGTQP